METLLMETLPTDIKNIIYGYKQEMEYYEVKQKVNLEFQKKYLYIYFSEGMSFKVYKNNNIIYHTGIMEKLINNQHDQNNCAFCIIMASILLKYT